MSLPASQWRLINPRSSCHNQPVISDLSVYVIIIPNGLSSHVGALSYLELVNSCQILNKEIDYMETLN